MPEFRLYCPKVVSNVMPISSHGKNPPTKRTSTFPELTWQEICLFPLSVSVKWQCTHIIIITCKLPQPPPPFRSWQCTDTSPVDRRVGQLVISNIMGQRAESNSNARRYCNDMRDITELQTEFSHAATNLHSPYLSTVFLSVHFLFFFISFFILFFLSFISDLIKLVWFAKWQYCENKYYF
jgi:hypothetical protein